MKISELIKEYGKGDVSEALGVSHEELKSFVSGEGKPTAYHRFAANKLAGCTVSWVQPAHVAFSEFIDSGGYKTDSDIAKEMGYTREHVNKVKRGKLRPGRKMKDKIEIITGGVVKASMWGAE